MAKITIIGIITDISEVETYDSGKQGRVVRVMEESTRYPNYYDIKFLNQRVKLIDKFAEGEEVRFRCAFNGALWEGEEVSRIYYDLICWGCKLASEPTTAEKKAGHAIDDRNEWEKSIDEPEPSREKERDDGDVPF